MRYGDQQLLRDYARLALRVAAAKNPAAKHDVDERTTLRSGYQMLKARMDQLSPKNRERFRYMLRSQVQGVNTLMARAKASGEEFSLADIEISLYDAQTREPVPDAPNVTLEAASADEGENPTTGAET